MLGLGGPTFISDWARAVARFADVRCVTIVRRLPAGVEPKGRGCGVGAVDGFAVAFVRARRLRPSRLLWRLNARLEATAIVRAASLLGDPPPDILHSHFYAGSAGVPRAAAKLGIPYVVTEHSSSLATRHPRRYVSKQGLDVMSRVFEGAALVLFVGREQLEAAEHLELHGRFAVVPNPLGEHIFAPGHMADGVTRLVSVGHLIDRKRHDLLLQTFALVRSRHPKATLDIVGEGPRRAVLQRIASQLGVESAVTFHGSVPRPIVAKILAGASVYVHTSERESFGVAIVEALLAGVPVVTTHCGGVSSELPEHVAVAVDPPTPDALA
ncbi:MAG TPA: glycosyltransferase, partial [Acidimicrobiia bacterium]|nr:glycosyltransferase [Acidimicrobiia bacterium]